MTAKPTSQASLSKEDLLCPVCCEVFSLPVLLKCGHNSCKECLKKLWEWKGGRECPVCRTTSSSERPPINLALKIAADMFTEQRTTRGEESTVEEWCLLHNEKLKLFCHNDEEPICVVCQLSNRHNVHACCPVEEAALEKKVRRDVRNITEQFRLVCVCVYQWRLLIIMTGSDSMERYLR